MANSGRSEMLIRLHGQVHKVKTVSVDVMMTLEPRFPANSNDENIFGAKNHTYIHIYHGVLGI